MRSVRGIGGLLAVGAPALLAAMAGVGCGGDRASGQGLPDRPEPVASVVGDGLLLPGDQRVPGARVGCPRRFPPGPLDEPRPRADALYARDSSSVGAPSGRDNGHHDRLNMTALAEKPLTHSDIPARGSRVGEVRRACDVERHPRPRFVHPTDG